MRTKQKIQCRRRGKHAPAIFVWNVFWRISSRKMVNIWCIYRDAICGLTIMLWILHWNCAAKEVGGGKGMSMWRSSHLVSVALRVKKNIGLPSCVIISYSSPIFCSKRIMSHEEKLQNAWHGQLHENLEFGWVGWEGSIMLWGGFLQGYI